MTTNVMPVVGDKVDVQRMHDGPWEDGVVTVVSSDHFLVKTSVQPHLRVKLGCDGKGWRWSKRGAWIEE